MEWTYSGNTSCYSQRSIELQQFDSLNRVKVKLVINKGIRIPKNSIAKIQSDFLGVNTISMVLSREDELAVEGDTLRAALATTIQEEVSMQMLPIKMKTENMLATLDTVLESIKYVFNKETQKTLANTFIRIQTTIENLEHSSFTLDTVIPAQKGAMERLLYNIKKWN